MENLGPPVPILKTAMAKKMNSTFVAKAADENKVEKKAEPKLMRRMTTVDSSSVMADLEKVFSN